jgi:hypothetical protein
MTLTGGVAVASLAFASLPLTAGAAAPAAASSRAKVGSLTPPAAAASYLIRQLQGPYKNHYSSSFTSGGQTFTFVNYGETIDAALSIDAAGVGQTAVKRVTKYLEKHVTDYVGTAKTGYSPGAAGKLVLLAGAQEVRVRDFGGVNLVHEIRSTEGQGDAAPGEFQQNPIGTSKADEFFSTAGQALAMLGIWEMPETRKYLNANARSFLKAQQCADGGFPTQLLANPKTACQAGSDIDSTGYALQVLHADGDYAAARRAVHYLWKVQNKNGSFGADGGNANSTALAIQGLRFSHRSLRGALPWLEGQQIGCSGKAARRGAVNFQKGYDAAATLQATSQAGAALAKAPLTTIERAGAKAATPTLHC